MRFREGMRRVSLVFWGAVSAGIFLNYGNNYPNGWSVGSFFNAIGYTLAWTMGFWLFCVVVRWIWIGFMGPERAE